MNDIEKVEGRLFKYYSVIACGRELTPDQLKHFLGLSPYPEFSKDVTIEYFQEVLFGPKAKLAYVYEEFDEDVPDNLHLGAYQFSPVYSGRISLAAGHWKKKFKAEKILGTKRLENSISEFSVKSLRAAEEYKLEVESARKSGYLERQTRGLLAGARYAVDYMRDFEKFNSPAMKYGPGLIDDVNEWLDSAEASGEPISIDLLITHMVEKFTKRRKQETET